MKIAIVAIADTHIGSMTGLCPPDGIRLDNGARMTQGRGQALVWEYWQHFWNEYVPAAAKGCKKRIIVHNGDIIDGNHHGAVDIAPNVQTQEAAAIELFAPLVKKFDAAYFVRGTEAHGGIGETSTERIARALGGQQSAEGNFSDFEVVLDANGGLFQFAHHISTTSSSAYETSALMREINEAGRDRMQNGAQVYDLMVRAHRHRYTYAQSLFRDKVSGCLVLPAWQLKTPFVYRIDRVKISHIGGCVILVNDDGSWEIKSKIYHMPAKEAVKL